VTRVAIVSFASEVLVETDGRTDAEILAPVVDRALDESGLSLTDIGVMGTASSEFLNGVVGGVMGAFDALPGWPPLAHSHLEGDGAFALYESWVRLLAGESKAAIVCAFSRPLADDKASVLIMQLDPYVVAPLAPRSSSLAALQARVLLDSGRYTQDEFAAVVRARRGGPSRAELMRRPYMASPLRELDCSTVCAGAAALVLAVDEVACRSSGRPAWITGMEHRIESQALGRRDLSVSPSTQAAAQALGLPGTAIDVAELHAPFSHQELVLRDAIGAREIGSLNPSGGALPADPIMVTGLIRMGSAARAVMQGDAGRAVGHATNGPCLQQNLLCLIEADGADT
jgi:acetyl-CoA acetyltransferase